MYSKLFQSMFDGSLATRGPWQALVTFQQLLILADRFGVVDIHPTVISRRTLIPLDIIELGIAELEKPDPLSRDPAKDGRRIERLSSHRDWGWQITNYRKYSMIRSAEDRRDYQQAYYEEKLTPKRQAKRAPKANGAEKISFDFANAAKPPHAGWVGITEEKLQVWGAAYPAVSVIDELTRASVWLVANPANRKSNYERFIVNWLRRSQESAQRRIR